MEVQFKISGTYNDCYELLRAFHRGFRIEGILEEDDEPVVYKKQEPEPSFCRCPQNGIPDFEFTPPPPPDWFPSPDPDQVAQDAKNIAQDAKNIAKKADVDEFTMLTPMGPMPVVKNSTGEPIQLQRKETKSNGAKLNTNLDTGKKSNTGKRELSPEGLEVHCHTCATLFHPKFTDMQYCSKRCYMIEWRETHKQPVVEKPVKCVVSPLAVLAPEERAKKLEALSKKLKEIKENCPAPTPRPDITKELS